MRELSDEEKAQLQAKADQVRMEGIHRIHGKPLTRIYGSPLASVGRIMGEVAAGVAGGFVGMVPFLSAVHYASKMGDGAGPAAALFWLMFLFIFMPITHPLGSAIGVYLVGKRGNETGSFLAAFGGGFLGSVIGIGIWWKWFNDVVSWGRNGFLAIPGLLIAPIIATVVFNLVCKYRSLNGSIGK